VAPGSTPYITWWDNSGGPEEIYVRRWNGSIWEEAGAGSASGGGISNNGSGSHWPSIAVNANSTPYITWENDTDGIIEIYVRRWNGSTWEPVGSGAADGGGISNNSGDSKRPALTIGTADIPYTAWSDNSDGDYEIYVKRWLEP
jgi:hypothetical protein